ncbi:MAG TPA: HAMP domain-containing protein, partial [Candidatus Dormibacteraeota bacterium]|nr:HAMP domain-containing protein [Candidatus Dormibacteraeota bacterium]
MKRRGLTARMIAVSAVMLAVVATAFTTLLDAIGDLRGSTRWTEHSVGVLAAASELQNVTSDFSSATRNYVDDPDQTQLQHWGQLRLRVSSQADSLVRNVRDNPVQTLTAQAIRERIRSLQADWASPLIALAGRPETLPRALEIAQGNSGRTRVAAIRLLFEHFDAREKALGLARGKAARTHAHQAAIIAVVSLAALMLAIVVLAVLLARTVSLPVRRIALAAAKVGKGDLSTRVPEGGQAEIGALARAFNMMAVSLRDQRDELETQNSELEAQQVELEEALDGLAAERDEVDGFRRFIELVSREQDPDRLAGTILKELCEVVGA